MPAVRLVLLAAVVALTVIIGTAAVANLMVRSGGTAPQSTTTSTGTTTASVPPSSTETTTTVTGTSPGPSGTLLLLGLNTTKVSSGAGLEVNVSEYNPSASELNVSKGDSWPLSGLGTSGCPSLYYPFGVAVLQGVYTSANFSLATPIDIFPEVACPALVMYITGYLFMPTSENATVLPGTGHFAMAATVSVGGVYGAVGSMPNQPVSFAPGRYTVVAGDEWGSLAFAYFTVSS